MFDDSIKMTSTPAQQNSDKPATESEKFTLRGHLPALDGVRGLAILMVLVGHFTRGETPSAFVTTLSKVTAFGALGVDLFFILSGFLITGILCDMRKDSSYFRNFYMRRTLRIFPLYYGVLFVTLIIVPIFVKNNPEVDTLVQHQQWLWLYGANIFVAIKGSFDSLPYFSHFWSLAVEEHFYLVWPLVIYFTSRNRKTAKTIAAAIVVGALALKVGIIVAGAGVNDVAMYALTPFRLDSLCLGGLLAIIGRDVDGPEKIKKYAPRVTLFAVVFIVLVTIAGKIFPEIHQVVVQLRKMAVTICLCAPIIFSLTGPRFIQNLFKNKIMMLLGKYSYGIYVYHFIGMYALVHYRTIDITAKWIGSYPLAMLAQLVVGTVVTLVVSVVSYHLFEQHFLKLKEKFPSVK